MRIITTIMLLAAISSSVLAYETLSGADTNLCVNAPVLPYDIAFPNDWLSVIEEIFIIPPPVGYAGAGNRLCMKVDGEGGSYRMYTLDEAHTDGYTCTKVDGDSRTEIPRSALTHGDRFLEGDPCVLVDGDTIILTGVVANNATQDWDPVIDIYESSMVPANGEEFDFSWKASYDPSAVDPDFDYYMVGGQVYKEGANYVLTFAGYRVPEGKDADWPPYENEIQTIFYQVAHKDVSGNYVWDGYPRMINAYVDRNSLNGNELGTKTVVQSGPRTQQAWSAPVGGQINGIHLNGDIFEFDGERWFYWVWFEGGNHVASARLRDDFTFADPNPNKLTWHTPLNVVQNSNPVMGEQEVNENATVFKRNGKYYFIFTHGHVASSYGMSYIVGNSFEEIARGVGAEHQLYECYPDRGDDNTAPTHGRREAGGSGRAIEKSNGDLFMFYGISTFDRTGGYLGRKIYYSKLAFNPDGTIVPLKEKPANGAPNPADPLYSDSDAADLLVGQPSGLLAYEHNGATYMPVGGLPQNAVDVAIVPGGMHVVTAAGLTYYSYDSTSGKFTEGGSYSWGTDTATAVAVAADGTLFVGGSNGFGHFTYSGGVYSSDAWFNNSTKDIVVDSNGHIHVAQTDGLSGWTYAAGSGLSLTAWNAEWKGGSVIAIDSNDVLHVSKSDGIGDVIYNGSSYTFGGHWSDGAGITDIAIDEVNGQVWVTQGDGVQVVNQSTYALLGWSAQAGGFNAVEVDSAGQVHLGKADGMGSYGISGASVVWDGASWLDAASGVHLIAEAVLFDSLNPGTIGNSQILYEIETPAAFTSETDATGNGAVSYQWQQALSAGGPWSDISGATGTTYAFPSQNGAYPTNTTLYARRRATDSFEMDYSNGVTLEVLKVLSADAYPLVAATGDGVGSVGYDSTGSQLPAKYTVGPANTVHPDGVDVVAVPGGVHVVSSTGLTYYDYDIASGTFSEGGSYAVKGAMTSVARAADGSLFAGGTNGFGHFTYSGGAYASDAWYPSSNTKDIAIDSNGHIHVAQTDGLSGWTYASGSGLTLTAWLDGGNWHDFGAVAVDSSGLIHVGKYDGMASLNYTGSAYSYAGNWADSGAVNDIELDEANGRIWVGHGNGVGVWALADYASIASHNYGDIRDVLIDSGGHVHLGRSTGIMGAVISGSDVVLDGEFPVAAGIQALVEALVPLIPGSIGNSQILYEDEDPAPFTSTAGATGNGPIAYQWQYKIESGGTWADLDGATATTYDAPRMYQWFTVDTELFVKRKAMDGYGVEYSNEASLLIKKLVFSNWAEKNGLVVPDDAPDADPDGDDMVNLAEYALGGDPNVDDAASFLPTSGVSDAGASNVVEYIYRRRRDRGNLGLAYSLNASTNLLSLWLEIGALCETGSEVIDETFESVTNSIPFDAAEGFIQLEISKE